MGRKPTPTIAPQTLTSSQLSPIAEIQVNQIHGVSQQYITIDFCNDYSEKLAKLNIWLSKNHIKTSTHIFTLIYDFEMEGVCGHVINTFMNNIEKSYDNAGLMDILTFSVPSIPVTVL